MTRFRSSLYFGAAMALVATATVAQAGVLTTAGDMAEDLGSEGGLVEIVVTAQERALKIQDDPIAVRSLSANSLENSGLTSAITELSFTTGAQSASPRIRGVGTAFAPGGNENAISAYVYNVFCASAPASMPDFKSISQICHDAIGIRVRSGFGMPKSPPSVIAVSVIAGILKGEREVLASAGAREMRQGLRDDPTVQANFAASLVEPPLNEAAPS